MIFLVSIFFSTIIDSIDYESRRIGVYFLVIIQSIFMLVVFISNKWINEFNFSRNTILFLFSLFFSIVFSIIIADRSIIFLDKLIFSFYFILFIFFISFIFNKEELASFRKRIPVAIFFLLLWVIINSFIREPDKILYTNQQIISTSIDFSYSWIISSQNHFAILISFCLLYFYYEYKYLIYKLFILFTTVFFSLLLDSLTCLFAFFVVIFLHKFLKKINVHLILIFWMLFPIFYTLYSFIFLTSFGIESDLVITLNNRILLWDDLISRFSDFDLFKILFGEGLFSNFINNDDYAYTQVFGYDYEGVKSAHSTPIQILLDSGLVGFILFYYLIYILLKNLKFNARIISLIFFFLIVGSTESIWNIYFPTEFFLFLVIILLSFVSIQKPKYAVQKN